MKIFYSFLAVLLLTSTNQIFAQGNFSSNVTTGNWDVAGTWTLTSGTDADGIPDADDNVTILDGHTITMPVSAACASITVGGGTSGVFNLGNGAADDLVVSGNITVSAGALFRPTAAGVRTLTVGGNISNSGTFDLRNGTAVANITFNGTANQTVSGSGATTDFNTITCNNTGAANNNTVELASTGFTSAATATTGFLTLTAGIFKLTSSLPSNTAVFASGTHTIPAGSGYWHNSPSATSITGHAGTVTLAGLLRVSTGTFRIGTLADHNLEYTGSASQIIVDGGGLRVTGRLCRDGNNASTTNFTISSSILTVGIVGSTSTTRAIFEIANAGSSFTQTGGTIAIYNANALYGSDYFVNAGTYTVTGGVVYTGTSSSNINQVFRVNTTIPMSGISSFDASGKLPTCRLMAPVTLVGGIVIDYGATLDANNFDITLAGNWFNRSTFIAGTGTVTFNGTGMQDVYGPGSTSFYNMIVNNSSTTGVNITTSATVTNALTLTDGYVNTSATGLLTLTDNATVTGASDASFVNGPVRKVGDDAFTFPTGKSAGGFYQPISISAPANTTDDFTAEYIYGSAKALDPDVLSPVKNISTCGYWTLDKNSAAAASIDVTLSWNANVCNTSPYVTNPATLTVAHYNGAEWDEAGTSGSFTGNSTAGTVTRNAVSIFSPFSLGNTVITDNPLPVRFGNLQGNIKNNGVQVDWDIYTEDNVSHYEVLRSADGIQFSNIGFVAARNTGQVGYGFFDAAPLTGMNFYRIRAVDKDGKYSYSIIVRINLKKTTADITVYPNPVQDGNISFQSPVLVKDVYTVRLINSIAQEVYNKKIEHSGGSLSYSFQLPAGTKPGVYYLQLVSENNKLQKKILVQ